MDKQVGQIITEACMLRLQLCLKIFPNLTDAKVKITFENFTPADMIRWTMGEFCVMINNKREQES